MKTSSTTVDTPGGSRNHTLTAILWLGLIYLLSWKPAVLEQLLAGSESLAVALVKVLEGIRIFS